MSITRFNSNKMFMVGISLFLWLFLWLFTWIGSISTNGWLQLGWALGLFVLPGVLVQFLLYEGQRFRLSAAASIGFSVSVACTSLAGFVAKVFHLPLEAVGGMLWLTGAVAIVMVFRRKHTEILRREAWSHPVRVMLPLVLVSFVLAGVLSIAETQKRTLQQPTDHHTYNAYITEFRSEDTLDFDIQILDEGSTSGTTRLWMMNWPISQAVITSLAQLPTLHFFLFFRIPLLALTLIAVYELARTLGLSHAGSLLAVVAQVCSFIVLEENNDLLGWRALYDPSTDKIIVAFLMAPTILKLGADYLNTGRRRYLAALAFVSLGAHSIHVTLTAITLLITLLFVLLSYLNKRQTRLIAFAVLTLTLIAFVPAPLRFLGETKERYFFNMDSAQQANAMTDRRDQHVAALDNDRFYGINPELLKHWLYVPVVLATVLAFFRLRQIIISSYLIAIAVVLLFALNPYTGWILGMAITPFHLWRITWFVPFGISIAFIIDTATHMRTTSIRLVWLTPFAGVILLLIALLSFPDWFSRHLISAKVSPDYQALINAGEWLDTHAKGDVVVVGDKHVNNHIPTLSAHTQTIIFRTPRMTADFGQLNPNDISDRINGQWLLTASATDAATRSSFFKKYHIDYLLLAEQPMWPQEFQSDDYDIQLVATFDERIFLYQVTPKSH